MTDKKQRPDIENPEPQDVGLTNKPAKPPISKANLAEDKVAMTPTAPMPAKTKAESKPAVLKTEVKANGRPAAEHISRSQEALLEVDSYEEAEVLLNSRPDLIEPARVVFGSVVPTTGQNELVDLAIKAAAEDDAMTLRDALKAKRRNDLNLTGPEVSQLLEFAGENMAQFPHLSLFITMLVSDDLTHLKDGSLWQKQKEIVLTTEKTLALDAMALWDEINSPDPETKVAPKPSQKKPKAKPVAVETVAKPEKKERPAPPPPIRVKKQPHKRTGSPPRWAVAGGFIFLLSMMSCGVCALSSLF